MKKYIMLVILSLIFCSCAESETVNVPAETTIIYNKTYEAPAYKYSLMYNYLIEPEKTVYREIYSGLKARNTSISVSGILMPDRFEEVYKMVTVQETEFYDLGATMEYSVMQTGCVNTLYVTYTKDEQARRIADICMQTYVDMLKEELKSVTDDSLKARKIHDFIIRNTLYDESATEADNLYGVFVDGKATCAGYAKSFKYLCDIFEIPCVTVTGTANGNHMWNYVYVNNRWVALDTTWDDPDEENDISVYYDYCLIDIAKMEESHTADAEYSIFKGAVK